MATTSHETAETRPSLAAAAPPSIDWKLALLFAVITFGIFQIALGIWQSRWARKVESDSRATLYYIGALVGAVLYGVLSVDPQTAAVGALLYLASVVLAQCANFSLKGSVESYVHGTPAQTTLSGLATFFIGPLYIQYQLNQIEKSHKLRVAWA